MNLKFAALAKNACESRTESSTFLLPLSSLVALCSQEQFGKREEMEVDEDVGCRIAISSQTQILHGQNQQNELDSFPDRSLESMRSVAYLRAETSKGTEVSFAMGRGRVAPKKLQTMPKIELWKRF